MADRVRAALVSLRVQSVPAYRKLVEDLGLPFHGPPAHPQPYQQPPSFQYQHAGAPPASQWTPYPVYNYPPPNFSMGYAPYPPPPQFSQAGPAYPYYNSQDMASSQQARGNPSPMQAPPPLPYSTSYSPHMPPMGLPNFGVAPSSDPFAYGGNRAFRPQYADSPGGHLRAEAGAFGD